MLTMTRTAFLLLSAGWKRFFAVICLIALLSLTAGLLGVFMLHGDGAPEPAGVAVVDLDSSLESRMILSALAGQDMGVFVQFSIMSEEQARDSLMAGEINAVFTLPEGFMQSVITGENRPIQAVYNPATPLRSALVQVMADSLLELLRVSQTGVYTALHYAATHAPEYQHVVFQRINMRYIGLAVASDAFFSKSELTATGALPPLVHYISHSLIFFYTLSLILLTPLIRESFPRETRMRLRLLGCGGIHIAAGWTFALWFWLMLGMLPPAIMYFAASRVFGLPVSVQALVVMPVMCFYLAALSALLGFLPVGAPLSGAALCLFSAGALVASGGVVPLSFLPTGAGQAASALPSYQAARMLGSALHGEIPVDALAAVLLTGILFMILCQIAVRVRH